MIQIKISKTDAGFQLLEIKGHAKSAPYGKDLVCAAVSAVFVGGVNNIKDIKNFDIKIDEGHAYIKANGQVSVHDETVIETIICGLKTIEEENSEFVHIKAE